MGINADKAKKAAEQEAQAEAHSSPKKTIKVLRKDSENVPQQQSEARNSRKSGGSKKHSKNNSRPISKKNSINIDNLEEPMSPRKLNRPGSIDTKNSKAKSTVFDTEPTSAKHKSLQKQLDQGLDEEMMEVPRKTSHKFKQVYDGLTDGGNKDYPSLDYNVSEQARNQANQTINLVISGHVDSGKSTLLGCVMSQLKEINAHQLKKLEKEAKGQNASKTGNSFAWVADSLEYERTHGITVDVNEKRISYNNKNVVFLDTPGHKDFVPKMISGAGQAEFAILVIDGNRNNFEAGMDARGQTREHVHLLNSLGVRKLIIAINKMDQVGWDKQNYDAIVAKLNLFLDSSVLKNLEHWQFIPISALSGHNIVSSPHKTAPASNWYVGPTLVQLFDNLESRCLDNLRKPFRLLIKECYMSTGHTKKGFLMQGRIEGGAVKKGDKLQIKPANVNITVKDLYIDDRKTDKALVGELIEVIATIANDDIDQIRPGMVLSSVQFSCPVAKKFVCEIITYDITIPILSGSRAIFYVGSNKQEGAITRLVEQIDPKTGEFIKKRPRVLNSNMAAIVEVNLENPICLETYSNFQSLGRMQIRDKGETLAVGTIREISY